MADAPRNSNYVPTLLAIGSDGVAYPLEVDTSTGRLLIEITDVSTTTPTIPTDAKRNDNYVPTLMATDDTDGTPTPLIVDNRNGLLFVDVLVE